jgi:hypothetical protein
MRLTSFFFPSLDQPVNSQQVQTYNAVTPPISALRITTVSPDEGVSQSQQYATPVSAQQHGFHSNISQETVNIVGSDEPSLVQNDNSKYYSSSEINQQKFYHTVGQGDRLHQTSTAKTSKTSNTANTGNASNTAITANIVNIANGSNTSKGSNTSNTSTPATSIKTTPSVASQPAWTQSLSNQMDADEFWTAVMTNIPLPVPNTLSQMPSHWTPVMKYKWGIVHIIHAIKNASGNVPSEKKGFLLRIRELCPFLICVTLVSLASLSLSVSFVSLFSSPNPARLKLIRIFDNSPTLQRLWEGYSGSECWRNSSRCGCGVTRPRKGRAG